MTLDPVSSPRPGPCNRLLDALLRECPDLRGALTRSTEKAGTQIYQEGAVIPSLWFPVGGLVSIVVRLRCGGTAEVQTIGNEGMVGLPAWLGLGTSPDTVVQQATGGMVSVQALAFRQIVSGNERARRLRERYAAYSFRFSSQTCVCNAHHSVKQRLCRWLLTSADRSGSREMDLSHAMLAEMLGVRRQTAGEALVLLQGAGAIAQGRNRIEIRDPGALEHDACECFRTTKDIYARLMEPLL